MLPLLIGEKHACFGEIRRSLVTRQFADSPRVFFEHDAVVSRKVADPVLGWLFVDMMVAALPRGGVRHQYESPAGQRLKQVLKEFLLDVLDYFLAVNEIYCAVHRAFLKIHCNRWIHRLIDVALKAINGDDLSAAIEKVLRGIAEAAAEIKDCLDSKSIHDVVPNLWRMRERIALPDVAT